MNDKLRDLDQPTFTLNTRNISNRNSQANGFLTQVEEHEFLKLERNDLNYEPLKTAVDANNVSFQATSPTEMRQGISHENLFAFQSGYVTKYGEHYSPNPMNADLNNISTRKNSRFSNRLNLK